MDAGKNVKKLVAKRFKEKPVLEATVKIAVKKRLKELGAYWFMPVQFGVGDVTLDFLVCSQSKFIGIETKAPGRELTKQQQITIRKMLAAGAEVYVIDNLEDAANLQL